MLTISWYAGRSGRTLWSWLTIRTLKTLGSSRTLRTCCTYRSRRPRTSKWTGRTSGADDTSSTCCSSSAVHSYVADALCGQPGVGRRQLRIAVKPRVDRKTVVVQRDARQRVAVDEVGGVDPDGVDLVDDAAETVDRLLQLHVIRRRLQVVCDDDGRPPGVGPRDRRRENLVECRVDAVRQIGAALQIRSLLYRRLYVVGRRILVEIERDVALLVVVDDQRESFVRLTDAGEVGDDRGDERHDGTPGRIAADGLRRGVDNEDDVVVGVDASSSAADEDRARWSGRCSGRRRSGWRSSGGRSRRRARRRRHHTGADAGEADGALNRLTQRLVVGEPDRTIRGGRRVVAQGVKRVGIDVAVESDAHDPDPGLLQRTDGVRQVGRRRQVIGNNDDDANGPLAGDRTAEDLGLHEIQSRS